MVKSFFINLAGIRASLFSEAFISLSAVVSDEQIGQTSDQNQTHHHSPDDNGKNSLVIVSPTLHL